MTQEPENHTIRLLQEMRAETETMRAENNTKHAETRADLLQVLHTVAEMAKTLNTVASTQVEHLKLTKELATRTTMLEVRMGQMQGTLDRLTLADA